LTGQARQQSGGLTFAAYPGDGAVLLAFDLDQGMQQDLAGFAVEYIDPDGQAFPVLNRLSFAQPVTSATTVRVRNGKVQSTDGPFAETKEQLGGYFIVDVKDLDEAIRWGQKCPGARYGSVEVRPGWEM